MICTACHAECEAGVKYCVSCGALMPLDEDSTAYFASIFRTGSPAVDLPEAQDAEADVATSVRPSARTPAQPGGLVETTGQQTVPMTPPEPLAVPTPRSPHLATPASPPTPDRSEGHKRSRALAIGAVTLLLVTVFGIGFLVSSLTNSPAPTLSPSTTSGSVSGTGTAAAIPAGAVLCSDGVARNQSASCEFAANVVIAVRQAGDIDPLVVSAYSPVTGQNYSMTCTRGVWIECSGGSGAVVYVRSG